MAKVPLFLDHDESDGSAEIQVKARFGGEARLCLLDTGAACSALKFDDFSAALPVESEMMVRGALGSASMDLVSVPSFELGPIKTESLAVQRFSAGHRESRNIVGLDLLKDWTLTLDLKSETLTIDDSVPREGKAMILGDRGHPYLAASLAGEDHEVLLDTGAGLTCVDVSVIAQRPECFTRRGESVGTDASGHSMDTPLYEMSGFACGGLSFAPHTIVALDLQRIETTRKFLMILGYSTLRQASWTLAFKESLWSVFSLSGAE